MRKHVETYILITVIVTEKYMYHHARLSACLNVYILRLTKCEKQGSILIERSMHASIYP